MFTSLSLPKSLEEQTWPSSASRKWVWWDDSQAGEATWFPAANVSPVPETLTEENKAPRVTWIVLLLSGEQEGKMRLNFSFF